MYAWAVSHDEAVMALYALAHCLIKWFSELKKIILINFCEAGFPT